MKYFIICGEASGDLHGANLVKALQKKDAETQVQAWGGDRLAATGATVLKHYRELAFMGFSEVLKNIGTILQNFRICKQQIAAFQPDAIILVDYPGFNLRMAKWAKNAGFRVFYYISPQLWAWKSGRVRIIKQYVDKMFVILPFEKDFYQKHGLEVAFSGHPLLDELENQQPDPDFRARYNLEQTKPIVALLPGSRRQEIKSMLPIMLGTAEYFPDFQFAVAGAPSIENAFYQQFLANKENVHLVENQTYQLLLQSSAALVTSGTATLETALFNVPQVVCYKGNGWSYRLAKQLVNKDLKYISLVNLIVDKQLVKELIQNDLNIQNLRLELSEILHGEKRLAILAGYKKLKERLGDVGASERTAQWIIELLKVETPILGITDSNISK